MHEWTCITAGVWRTKDHRYYAVHFKKYWLCWTESPCRIWRLPRLRDCKHAVAKHRMFMFKQGELF